MENKFITIKAHELPHLKTLINTGEPDDWLQLFYESKNGVYYQGDGINPEDDVKIDSELALKIWKAVESSDMMQVMRNEIEAEQRINRMLEGK